VSARLWDWAAEAYAQPGVEALCLALQDEHGQCVSYLLWAIWAARTGRSLDAARLAQAVGLARDWETKVTHPLRQARRALKAPRPGLAPEGRAAPREQVKAQDLAAERLLLEALEALAPAPEGPPRDPTSALAEAGAAWGPAPKALIEGLSRAFSPA